MSEAADAERDGWLSRLKSGLRRSSERLGDGITGIFTRGRLDDEAVESLEELLITADLGPATAARLSAALAARRFDRGITPEAVRRALADDVAEILRPVARPLEVDPGHAPHVVLVVGVNGSGKTTTVGKLARLLAGRGHAVLLAAADTFRAAAVEQLQVWGERAGCAVEAAPEGTDPAAVAYAALERARAERCDVLLIDTAGRLHNKADLMAQLEKVARVLRKLDPGAPHDVVLVLDGTTGQNAIAQVETFKELVEVTGLIVTKLDGSAKGGVLVALAERTGLAVHAVGVGEGADDLRAFSPEDYARSLLGVAGP